MLENSLREPRVGLRKCLVWLVSWLSPFDISQRLLAVNSFRGAKSGAGLVNYKCNKYPTKYFVKGLASECRVAHELGTSLVGEDDDYVGRLTVSSLSMVNICVIT